MSSPNLQQAVDHLYRTAVVDGSRTSTLRLSALADYCAHQLQVRGIDGVEKEVPIPGGGREKQWDIAWKLHGKYRLAVSLKSILRNLGGTVPNRIDDLIGEVANAQMYSPEIVIGYLIVFNTAEDSLSRKHNSTWSELLQSRLAGLSGRKAPFWSVGMIEAYGVVEVDFSQGPKIISVESDLHEMFDTLIDELNFRHPSLADSRDS